MKSKYIKPGFTIVELLTVLTIITILVGLLIPSLSMVRNAARRTKQNAQFATISQGLLAFRGDYGNYPYSGFPTTDPRVYSGSQMLTEALLGWDLLGFHPDSDWRADGLDRWGGNLTYDPLKQRYDGDETLYERTDPYLELATANAYRLGDSSSRNGLFADTGTLEPDTYVLCDSFSKIPVKLGEKLIKAGKPILYYRANTAKMTIETGFPDTWIYNCFDNDTLVRLVNGGQTYLAKPDIGTGGMYQYFREYITDQRVFDATSRVWPVRADSYILISAGPDGIYGTSDDMKNFEN